MLPTEIVDFYLTHAPYAHSDKPISAQSIDLSVHGWSGNAALNALMQYVMLRHLSDDRKSGLFFTAANDVSTKCEEVFGDLDAYADKGPGALICIKKNLKLKDDNTCIAELTETYATCLFRHIRNAIAHANYRIAGDTILLLDQASKIETPNPNYTFVMLTTISFLKEFARVITSSYESFELCPEDKERLKGLTYRIPRSIVLNLKER